ncbi:MAG: alpha/beta hydrolase [Thaumarchaeota archaeon]|nr:alpha/beta hydrolase [Nitrososphaerota archaeon]
MESGATHEAPSACLLIHGAGGNHLLWKRVVSHLSGPRSALALDLPGHPSGPITCQSIKDYSEWVHEYIAKESLPPVSVCGHSMGSAIAITLALDHPDDVLGLVLIGAGAKLGVDPKIIEGLRDRPLKAVEQLITPMSFSSVSLEMGREARAALSVSNLPVFLNDYLACSGFDVRERLIEIKHRTLLICGEQDRMTPPKWTQFLHAGIASSDAYFVRDAGHMVPLEKPEACGRLLQSFLSGFSR